MFFIQKYVLNLNKINFWNLETDIMLNLDYFNYANISLTNTNKITKANYP